MDSNESKALTKDDVLELVIAASISRLSMMAGGSTIEMKRIDPPKRVLAHWMTLILVAGESLRVTFKAHFSTTAAQQLAQKSLNTDADVISSAQVKDFMKEYCNMTAGNLKNAFLNSQIEVGISLPLLTRGFDKVFFTTSYKQATLEGQWELTDGKSTVYCSATVEMLKDVKIQGKLSTEDDSSGDIEFL